MTPAEELVLLRAQKAAVLDLCDQVDLHDQGQGHWVSTNLIRAALADPLPKEREVVDLVAALRASVEAAKMRREER